MDYDADGDEDIVSGSYTGEIYFFERKDDGTLAQGTYLMNNQDEVLHVGISVVPELMDTDADGDLDMVVGTRSDGVWLFENTGSRAKPAWAVSGKELKTKSGKEVEGSNAHHADWNGDGRIDLITGSEWGGAKWYKNVGKPNAPVYEDAKVLVEKNEYAERTEEEGPKQREESDCGEEIPQNVNVE